MSQTEPQLLRILQGINQGNKRTHTFNVDFSEKFGEKFKGKFTVHYPSQMEVMRIGILQSQLLGGVAPMDARTDNLVFIISTLDTILDTAPDWFNIMDPDLEYEMLEGVYREYANWKDSFRRGAKQDNTGEVSGDSGSQV